ncbi:hypothetical protein CerSpe_224510 [Prunus speciosa]
MANPRLRSLLWWRWWAKKDWAIAAVGFTVVAFALTLLSNSWRDEPDSEITRPFHPINASDLVELTLLQNAKARGALCLDGSAPGYHFKKGFGSGANNWLLHIEGGGWCNTIESCNSWRKGTPLGYSKYMDRKIPFSGILSSHPSQNPEFFNWNKVKIRYCDGTSLAGHPENELKNGSAPFFRGQLNWEAVMDELLSVGLSKAKQGLFSGCSAGGLATLIHCDDFRSLLPTDATVKCLADAGYRRSLLKALKEFQKNKEGGMFISSCFIHCQAWMTETWHAPTSPRINNKTIAESVGDWYVN